MKEKKRYISLKTQIIGSTLIPIIICLVVISSVNSSSLFKAINETARAEFLQIGQKYSVHFESKIDSAMSYLSMVSSIIEFQIDNNMMDRKMLQKEIMQIFKDYELVDGSSVYFEPNMYDGKDLEYMGTEYGTVTSGRICWYYYTENDETLYLPEGIGDDVEFELPHYTDSKDVNKPIYTDPIVYEIEGKNIPMFTLTYPVNDSEGNFIGAVTVDLFLEELYQNLQNEKIYKTGYIIIANDNDQVIYSPRFEDIGQSRESIGINYDLPDKNETAIFFNAKSILNGKRTLITIDPIYIPKLDCYFYISVAAPNEEINSRGFNQTITFVIFSLIAVMIIASLLYYRIGKITAPMKMLTDNIDKIARGDYNARIEGDFNSEFTIVKDSVNAMADSIEAYVEESGNSLNILKSIMNGLEAYIYVTIPETGELLFINDNMKKHFNIESDGIGQYCYKVLKEGMNKKCDFCPCYQLDKEPDKVVVWEEHNNMTKRDYRNTDCYIDWVGGVKVHLQHSIDITDIKTFMNDKLKAERATLEMKHEKEKAEEAAKAKNDFLAKMSHEIRTPMNAVMGMSEIMLRKNLPQDVYENALGIKSASMNLLSIINDILDFSKIESGMMEIIETDYQLPSLVNDVIGIIRIRLIDKPIQFAVDIDPNVPAYLIGDEVRIRQMLINLLSNAVKYTNEGFISLKVTGVVNENTVTLNIDITDSGIGIKEEDIGKLFNDFVQIDTIKNRGIVGTGLGLAIAKNLCKLMGGDITVKSEYGKGSTFTVTIMQRFEDYKPFASIESIEGKSVLLYETRQIYKESLINALEGLGLKYENVESIPALCNKLEEYDYVFISSFMYGSINPMLSKLDNSPDLVLLSDVTETLAPKNVRILTLPAYSLSVANVLDNVYDDYNSAHIIGASFIAPEAKVLVVDDVTANLKVCEGLLLPYEMQVTLCSSGREAIELTKNNEYDLVFMDHMMPEMDGLEVTGYIRKMEGEYYKKLPIVALTANAVSGVREMFIQNGMNDFLAKPIETAKLDVILDKWIPTSKRMKAKQKEAEEESKFIKKLRSITELFVDKALSVVGGSYSTYERVVKMSVRLLPENVDRLNSLINDDLPNYSIEVHGLKGVLNNIGAYGLGMKALELEEMSRNGEHDVCKELHPSLINKLTKFQNSMQPLLDEEEVKEKEEGNIEQIIDALPKLEEAADYYDNATAISVISTINKYTYGQFIDEVVQELTQAFELFDFDKATELLDKLKGGLNNE